MIDRKLSVNFPDDQPKQFNQTPITNIYIYLFNNILHSYFHASHCVRIKNFTDKKIKTINIKKHKKLI